jgi:hypothetical protein
MDKSSWTRFKGAKPQRSKYNNVKVVVDGMRFDSRAEADYYQQLKLRKRAGEVIDFKCQESFEIIPAFTDATGYHHRPVTYRADFVVFGDGYTEIVDVKGHKTREFTLKWKMLKWKLVGHPEYRFTIVASDTI